ncbi:Hypothetical predicted protein [Cloeon dipterum]|uniref:Uncharacterized protein n=1 Tax=Cloeon dipterum TaxID=197152 RepID=A0A8S1EEJ1_9INSE|nr:Hypothetical predicted protein [Cloeon dipterum]
METQRRKTSFFGKVWGNRSSLERIFIVSIVVLSASTLGLAIATGILDAKVQELENTTTTSSPVSSTTTNPTTSTTPPSTTTTTTPTTTTTGPTTTTTTTHTIQIWPPTTTNYARPRPNQIHDHTTTNDHD